MRLDKLNLSLYTLVICLGLSTAAEGDSFGAELRATGAFPGMSEGNLKPDMGFGFDGTLSYSLISRMSVYGGVGWHQFSTGNLYLEQSGYNIGIELSTPLPKSALKPRFRVGITYEEILLKKETGEIVENTGHGIGFEIDAAVAIDLGRTGDWRIMPGISYRSLSRDVGEEGNIDLKYIALDLGICIHF